MEVAMNEMQMPNDVPVSDHWSAKILTNERARGAQEDLRSYSNHVVMCFVNLPNGLLTLPSCIQS